MNRRLHPIRHALRNLVRSPSFTLSATLTLALGMAATTIIFSTFHSLILRPLPFADAASLHALWQERDGTGMSTGPSAGLVRHLLAEGGVFDELAVYAGTEHSLTGHGEPIMLSGAEITAGLPALLRVEPVLGRTFTDAEVRENAQVVLLSEAIWRTRFGADRGVLGTSIQLGPETRTVIGVMPARFHRYQGYGRPHEYWVPINWSRARFGLSALSRVQPGAPAHAAAAAVNAIAVGLPPREGSHGEGWSYALRSVVATTGGGINASRAVPRLFAAAALLLLIGCANVAGLLLMRLHTRRREMAVRAALGARTRHILAELGAEQLLIASAAGALGVLLAVWGIDLIRAVRPEALASLDNVAVNSPVLLFAAGLVILTTLLFGTLPALAVARADLAGSLHAAGGPRLTSGSRSRSVLVTLQLALSTLLLVSGFLLVRSMHRLQATDLGFRTEGLLVANVPLPSYRYDEPQREALLTQLSAALQSTPGIESVGVSTGAPPRMGVMFAPQLDVEGSGAATDDIQFLKGGGISSTFLATLGARMLEGRVFSPGDAMNEVAVVNRSFAERFWPGESALGRRFRLSPDMNWQTIIGVVDDLRLDGPLNVRAEPMMFWPLEYSTPGAALTIRTAGNPLAMVPALRQHLARLDGDLPIRELATMEQLMAGTFAMQRFNMIMIGLFAAAAALLCAIGLYGLVSYSFEQRVREVGIRIALGATPGLIRTQFLSQAVRLAAIGVPLGLLCAWLSATVTAALVHGVGPRDPVAFAMALMVISLVVLPAGWLPARRAARTEPLEALRRE